jgi:hypothetical protein
MSLMRSRHLLLASVVLTVGAALWLAAPGLALRKAVVQQVFSPRIVRLEAIEKKPVGGSTDWRIDHGVITAVSPTQLTLHEADGRIQAIPLSTATHVIRQGHTSSPNRLRPHLYALVTWPADGAAQSVVIDPVPGWFRKAIVAQLFGPKLVRLETIEKKPVNGSTDWRVDRGVITAVSSTQLTLREADGRVQSIPLAGTTEVFRKGRMFSPDVLSLHWHVVVTWPAIGAAQAVDVELAPGRRAG